MSTQRSIPGDFDEYATDPIRWAEGVSFIKAGAKHGPGCPCDACRRQFPGFPVEGASK